MNEEEYLKWKAELDKSLSESFKPIDKEERRDRLLDYYSWLINKHTEQLNEAVENKQILDHSLNSFYVHDGGCIINRSIMFKQPAPFITISLSSPKRNDGDDG